MNLTKQRYKTNSKQNYFQKIRLTFLIFAKMLTFAIRNKVRYKDENRNTPRELQISSSERYV